MPYRSEYVKPAVVLEHQGITVYAAYEDDDYDHMMTFHFTLDPQEGFHDPTFFDVRDLPNPGGRNPDDVESRLTILRDAIDSGALKALD